MIIERFPKYMLKWFDLKDLYIFVNIYLYIDNYLRKEKTYFPKERNISYFKHIFYIYDIITANWSSQNWKKNNLELIVVQ